MLVHYLTIPVGQESGNDLAGSCISESLTGYNQVVLAGL